jgi:hypothetical protein
VKNNKQKDNEILNNHSVSTHLSIENSNSPPNKSTMKKITQFKVNISQSNLDDLKARLKNTRWPVKHKALTGPLVPAKLFKKTGKLLDSKL